jgi:uncharacterized protein YbjT (DUF2867 family)
MRQRAYFVAGGTGKQGGALARQLLAHGQRVRVYTRNPGGSEARLLQRLGADLFPGGFEDAGPLERAMRGCDGAFAVATFTEGGVEAEVRNGRALVDAARRSGVPHLVYSSMAGADKLTGVAHLDSKLRVESYLGHAGVPYTILAPVFFMENWLTILPGAVGRGRIAYPLPAQRLLQMVAVDDVAAFARMVLERPTGFENRRIEIAGDALPMEHVARILSGEARRELPYHAVPLQAVWARDEALGRLCSWLDWEGTRVDIERLRTRHREVAFTRFAVWARRQDWDTLLAPPAPSASAAELAWAQGAR